MRSILSTKKATKPAIRVDFVAESALHFQYPEVQDVEPLNIACALLVTVEHSTLVESISLDHSTEYRTAPPVTSGIEAETGEFGLQQQSILHERTLLKPGQHIFPVLITRPHTSIPNECSADPSRTASVTDYVRTSPRYRFRVTLEDSQLNFDFGGFKDKAKRRKVPFAIFNNPSFTYGEMPASFEIARTNFLDLIGVYKYSCTADTPVIASLFDFRLELLESPSALFIAQIRASILQTTKWQSQFGKEKSWTATQKFNFMTLSGPGCEPLYKLSSGDKLIFEKSARLPHDESGLLPSSNQRTKSPYTLTHEIVFEVDLLMPDCQKRRSLMMKDDITLASCLVMPENIRLPTYSSLQPELLSQADLQPLRPKDDLCCYCGYSLDMLFSRGYSPTSSASQSPEIPPKLLPLD